ncbi:MAG TPA: hypothetical protein VK558_00565 [Patescibacteria group bacterium]|nr:hypothetical protein [Patescibacteria group bacterium]
MGVLGQTARAAVLALVVALPARAGEIADFDAQFANAWAQYRDALIHSAPDHPDAAATKEALSAFTSAWRGLENRWSAQPPPQYGEDADFGDELAAIGDVARHAARQTRANEIEQAHITLQQVRALLADMRRKNGLERYTDQLDAFDEKLAETADDGLDLPTLTHDQQVTLTEQVAVLMFLAERMEKRAPGNLADDEIFLAQVEGIASQLRGLWVAVQDGQRAPITAALSDLRRSFDQFYLSYG